MTAPVPRASSFDDSDFGPSAAPPKPVGLANGEYVFVVAYWESNDNPTVEPFGFGVGIVANVNNGGILRQRIYCKKIEDAANEPASYTVGFAGGQALRVAAFAIPDIRQDGNPWGNVAPTTATGNGNTMTALGVTTEVADTTLLVFASNWSGFSGSYSPVAPLTEFADNDFIATYYEVRAAPGATGTRQVFCTASDAWGITLIPLEPAPSGLPPQVVAPVADVTAGGWTDEGGVAADLYQSVDEATASDADYIQSALSPSADLAKVRLAALNDPGVGTGHVVRYRYLKAPTDSQRVDLVVRLYRADGTTVVASNAHPDIPTTATAGEFTLTAPEADSIPSADYATGLVLGFEATRG